MFHRLWYSYALRCTINRTVIYEASAILPNFHNSRKTAAFFARNQVVDRKQLVQNPPRTKYPNVIRKKERRKNRRTELFPPLTNLPHSRKNFNATPAAIKLSGYRAAKRLASSWQKFEKGTRQRERERERREEKGKGKSFYGFFCRVENGGTSISRRDARVERGKTSTKPLPVRRSTYWPASRVFLVSSRF